MIIDYQKAEAFTDLMLGDIVEINGTKGPIYDIRLIQTIKDSQVYFEFRQEDSPWVKKSELEVIEKKEVKDD